MSTSGHGTWPGLRDGSGRAVGSSPDQASAGILGEEKFCWSYREDGLPAIMPSCHHEEEPDLEPNQPKEPNQLEWGSEKEPDGFTWP